ncbi:MAG: 3-hydroxyacyl-CoA dehydrogenase family protein [Thermodesulfobacteriota bacterium]
MISFNNVPLLLFYSFTPFTFYDFTGINLVHQFMKNPSIDLVSEDKPSMTLKRLVDQGHLGVKSGRGFYDYSEEAMDEIMRDRDIKLIKLTSFLEGI